MQVREGEMETRMSERVIQFFFRGLGMGVQCYGLAEVRDAMRCEKRKNSGCERDPRVRKSLSLWEIRKRQRGEGACCCSGADGRIWRTELELDMDTDRTGGRRGR